MEHFNKTIILTIDDINVGDENIPFEDININHFSHKCSPIQFLKADSVVYKYFIDNLDIPYITKVLKETINGESKFNSLDEAMHNTIGYLQFNDKDYGVDYILTSDNTIYDIDLNNETPLE